MVPVEQPLPVDHPMGRQAQAVDVAHKRYNHPSTLVADFLSELDRHLDKTYFRHQYLAQEIMSKFADPSPESAARRAKRAIDKWLATEVRNSRTESRLYTETWFGRKRVSSEHVISYASRLIRECIGDEPILSFGSFTGGASASLRRGPHMLAQKYLRGLTVTTDAIEDSIVMFSSSPMWWEQCSRQLRIVEGNILFTVPKNDTIDRVAAKEPDLNMYLQKAHGDRIRTCLRRVGIDLNDQTNNRRLARQGSIDGSLATIDLSSASDSVTRALVARLLPPGWFTSLDRIRSPRTVMPDKSVHDNVMMSSMGNAYTFELESLIFWALSRTVTELFHGRGVVSVYGDDIIVPSSIAPLLTDVLGYFGFIVNSKKSYWFGNFRESCGGHYHHGHDVTPFYIRRPVDADTDLIHLANSFRRWLRGEAVSGVIPSEWYPLWISLARYVPRALWGASDCDSISQLVCSGRIATHRLIPVVYRSEASLGRRPSRKLSALAKQYELGAYMWWLDVASRRKFAPPEPFVTNLVTEAGRYTLSRVSKSFRQGFGTSDSFFFPQEVV